MSLMSSVSMISTQVAPIGQSGKAVRHNVISITTFYDTGRPHNAMGALPPYQFAVDKLKNIHLQMILNLGFR
jgi:hypothetical protein